ncbi:sensor histidine kinase [Aneurinibacillus sp. REN35]|uniref:sensor histidine kinase n=1 Tax=Aneurinibacillus sp. REN35 TaxID=3237286 RepID=UPI0035293343
MKNKPLAVQIWLVFTGALALILCIVILLTPLLVRPFLVQDTYNRINEAQMLLVSKPDDGFDSPKRFRQKENGIVNHLLIVNGQWYASSMAMTQLPSAFLAKAEKQALLQTEPSKEYKQKIDKRTLYYVIRNAEADGRQFLLLSYTWDTYHKDFISSFIRQLFMMAALILIASFPFSYALSKYLSRPLVHIEKHVQRLAEREWHRPLLLDRKDEIGRLAASVEQMRKRLITQDETQRALLQNVSHELKTPVMVIRSYAQAVKDGIYPSGDLTQTVDVIEKEAERLESQIKQLLYLTRLDYLATQERSVRPVHIKNIVEETAQRLRWRRSDLEWVINVPDLLIPGDEEQIRTALENVLDNQIRYAKRSIHVTAEAQEEPAHSLTLRLANDGPPIPQAYIDTIFEPYRKGTNGQFGLGLAIVKRIMLLHHGSVHVVNEKTGPAFYLDFPSHDI